jgi:acyl-CoA synthetase (AMP-forming)/AMP-acid ligase II
VEGVNIDTGVIIEFMKTKIPLFMIPTKIFIEREFPLNQNGKIDKNQLKLKTPVFFNDKVASMSS